jgi:mono/diheme cytochrome c family protein
MLRHTSLLLVFLIVFASSDLARADQGTPADHPGAKVYAAQKCSVCHSVGGVGNKKLPLDGVGTKLTTDQIREWITHPAEAAKKANSTVKPPMRAYPKLSKDDLDALVAYMASLTK